MTPWAQDRLGPDKARIEARAAEMGVTLGALWSSRHREWSVSASGNGRRVSLRAKGGLAVALDGVMDDHQEATAA